ncbi:hypothetical protein DPM19_00155 [Actinomadura craniellae]|uniref:Uncharacterized protein n=1 Tax=Actinomadura craniellae TaxID=2231787 RepID=A0A365HC78_9ACTN|nr:hypothetical protein [Actinomadura craniellae]RAY16639.1 hypothetical protein DPM19_00155 [Actinomadura craniellae]
MRKETFRYTFDVLAAFPRARAHARGSGWITYLAERDGMPYMIVDSRMLADRYEEGDPILDNMVTVISFEDEIERDDYLAEHERRAERYRETVSF